MAKRDRLRVRDGEAVRPSIDQDVARAARWASLMNPAEDSTPQLDTDVEDAAFDGEDPAFVLEMEARNRCLLGIRPGSFDELLDSLSSADTARMREGFRAVEHGLRERAFSDRRQRRLLKHLTACAKHRSWIIRRAVARALQFLPSDAAVDPVVGALMADDNDCVAKEAERTKRLRIERSLLRQLPLPVDERMQQELLELETTYNRQTRDAAVRLGLWYAEFMVNAMNHQLKTAMSPVGVALETIGELLSELQRNRELLDQGWLDETEEWIRDARRHFGQSAAVLKHSLTYVRRTPPRYESIELRELLESAEFAVRNLPIVGITAVGALEINVEIPEKLTIDAVEDLLREALINILKNAIEASAGRRPIRLWVSASSDKRDVAVSVGDEGCGMTVQQYTRDIWRPFGSKKPGGTGLGMPLVKKIVEIDHRGHVEIASKVGVGTTVTIRLPISQRF